MAPQTKLPGQRRRRNKAQPQWQGLPTTGRTGPPPALPAKRPAWLKSTREWWKTIWASPMAAAWLPADVPTLQRMAYLVEAVARGDMRADLLSEIRQLEDRFGLSPKSRRALQWQITPAEDEPEKDLPEHLLPSNVRRIRPVAKAI